MSKTYIELNIDDYQTTSLEEYDKTKFNTSSLTTVVPKSISGNFPDNDFFGAKPIAISRIMEINNIAGQYPFIIEVDSDTQWVFLADAANAAATRRISLYEFKVSTFQYNYIGFITLAFPTATNHTIAGLRMTNDQYDVGTASVSGTSVTGVGTAWQASRLCVGNRIGFGSKNPNDITVWHQIASINSNTSITLTGSAGDIAEGDYVIEDMRAVVSTTNATATNGGLFVAKGLRVELFTQAGTTISAATTVDNIRAVYWLKDAATITMTAARGVAIQSKSSWTEQFVYIINTGTRIYKYNIREALSSLSAGASTETIVAQTQNVAVTGTISGANNGRIAAPKHGPAPNVDSLYFVTTTRIYRTALDTIVDGGATVLSSTMIEVPPGGTSTYPITSALSAVEYDGLLDKFIITSTGTAGARSYISEFRTDAGPMDHIFLVDDKQYDQTSADSSAPIHPSIIALPFAPWSQNGILHLVRVSASAVTNQMYAIPIGAHWRYAEDTNQYVITPALNTSTISKFYKVYVNSSKYLGDDTFSLPTEPYRVYFRTSGITDNTGSWTLISRSGDLSSITPTSEIQFKFEFKVIGSFCIPARINSLIITCEDARTDSRYEASIAKSNITTNTFAWLQASLWNENIPNLRIKLYNAVTKSLIVDDTVLDSLYGTWQYSTDGINWLSWNNTADVVGNYIRYSANSLPNGIKVSAILTRA